MTDSTNQEPQNDFEYDPEVLAEAEEAIKKLKPEDYLAMVEAANAVNLQTLAEAPCSCNMVCVTTKGAEIQFTIRDLSSSRMIERLAECVTYAQVKYGITPLERHKPLSAPVTPAPSNGNKPAVAQPVTTPAPAPAPTPANQPASQTGLEVIEVTAVFVAHTTTQKAYLRCRGGRFSKFGVPAYNDHNLLPPNFEQVYPVGQEYSPTVDMKFMHVDVSGKTPKVVAFSATP